MSTSSSRRDDATGFLSYHDILEREMVDALREIDRPQSAVFVSGLAAGLNVSFGALFMGMVLSFSGGFESTLVQQVALAGASTIGFLFVILGQTELFTAHTTMAILPVLDGRASLGEMTQLWTTVYVANLLGCGGFALLIAVLGPSLHIVEPSVYGALAEKLLPFSGPTIMFSGVVAGWLMGLVTWLVAATEDTVSRFFIVVFVTGGIGFAPFHHALLGTTEVLTAALLGQGVTVAGFLRFLAWTTVGNIVGGSVFVGLLNYGHVALTDRSEYDMSDTDTEAGSDRAEPSGSAGN